MYQTSINRACWYARAAQTGFADPMPTVTVFADKYAKGGEDAIGVARLDDALLTAWPTDAHFTCYTAPDPVRLRKDMPVPSGLSFEVVAVDIDNHQQRPTREDFHHLVCVAPLLDYVPNVIYRTRGGARLLHFIKPVSDPVSYEERAQRLRTKQRVLTNATVYEVDLVAKDWTRFFRLPRVVRDGVEEFDREVYVLHTNTLNLATFRPSQKKKKAAARSTGRRRTYRGTDLIVRGFLTQPTTSRNSDLFRTACHVLRRYHWQTAISVLDTLAERAAELGLSEREIFTTLESAHKTCETRDN